jgi:2-phosphoglycerate kinase
MTMGRIFIYGVAGTGKSFMSRYLKMRLNYPLIEADTLKEHSLAITSSPFISIGPKYAWRRFGAMTPANIIKGLEAVRASARSAIEAELQTYENVIMEGVFLGPAYASHGKMILMIVVDASRHRDRYFRKRAHTKEDEEGFAASRLLQDYLITEARQLGIEIIENHEDSPLLAESLSLALSHTH